MDGRCEVSTEQEIITANGAESAGQTRIAQSFAKFHEGRFLYVHGFDQWHVWNGTHWAADETGDVRRALVKHLETLWKVINPSDKDRVRELQSAFSAGTQNGILQIASILPQFATAASAMDADPFLLNVANGTLNLHTFDLQPHNPADNITKVARAAYDPQADTTEWEKFLQRVLPDEDVRSYLQRFTGLALLGIVREHILGIATGTGANGKGTYYTAVHYALGDYSHTAESDLFMTIKSNANSASPAVLGLRGTRYVVTSETEEGMTLAAALMKNLTGGDPITARPLYGRPITFDPSHTALMVTNHLPKVKGDDAALWRRIRVIPFDVVIPEQERDAELPERLRLSADAVLAWALAGLQDYQKNGMQTPAAVERRTAAYRNESDDPGRFMDSEIVPDASSFTPRSKVWESWERFAREEGASAISKPDLFGRIEAAYEVKTRKGTRGFLGMKLRDELDAETAVIETLEEN